MSPSASADTLIRWSHDQIPSPQALGIHAVVVPADKPAAVTSALGQGYRVFLEIDGAKAAGVKIADGIAGVIVKGQAPAGALARLAQSGRSVRVAEVRGKWPHIRTNWVTRNKDVLQVTSRSSQPWLENNQALIRIAARRPAAPVLLTYTWQPVTVADLDEGPRLENYLVAIAEAGSFGADLVLPLHDRFERALLMGDPRAREDWEEIRRSVDFYAWNAAAGRAPVANVGVVTADPLRSFEVFNLLARHNLPPVAIEPASVASADLSHLDLLIVLDGLDDQAHAPLHGFANAGGTVLIAGASALPVQSTAPPWRRDGAAAKAGTRLSYTVGKGRVVESADPPTDPNVFALDMRQLLGSERRVVDIWNGITVLVAPYASPNGDGMLLTALNYAAQPLPIQVRVRGTFSEVVYDTPGQRPVLLPFEHRNGGTEFVLPALRVGARVFLARLP